MFTIPIYFDLHRILTYLGAIFKYIFILIFLFLDFFLLLNCLSFAQNQVCIVLDKRNMKWKKMIHLQSGKSW